MRDSEFYQEIEHPEVPWGESSIHVPVFYYDSMSLNVYFLASREKLKSLMPSARMHPLRVTPWHGILSIATMQFRDCDLGPYNEASVAIPFTLDTPSPLFTGILRKGQGVPDVYIHSLPVTTEIARDAGVDLAGYPKFLARIEFEEQDDWITCRLAEGDRLILTLAGRRLTPRQAPRSRVNYFTVRGERLLRSEAISSERLVATSRDSSHARLKLGDHPIAQELMQLGMGRMMAYEFTPHYQNILSPPLESFAV